MIFEQTEIFYQKNIKAFKEFEKIINTAYNLNEEVSNRTVKRILVPYIAKNSKINIFNRTTTCISLFFIPAVLIYLFILLLISKNTPKKETSYDVIFDGWSNKEKDNQLFFERYYIKINDCLITKRRALIEPNVHKRKNNEILSLYKIGLIQRHKAMKKEIVIRILKNYLKNLTKLINISINNNINFIVIYVQILRQYKVHQLNAQSIKCAKYLISAGDNYYTPLMYHIYKENGVQNIVLIQNGFRTEEFDSSFYITCDHYFSLTPAMTQNHLGLKAYEDISYIGSLRLYNTVSDITINTPKFDIIFIETIVENDMFLNKNHRLYPVSINYLKAFEFLAEFSNKHKDLKIIYRVKKQEYSDNASMYLEKRNAIISNSTIVLDDTIHQNSYEAILDSKVVVYSHSTMGFESVLLNKNVLCCNFGKFNFLLSSEDEIGVIVEDNFHIFEKKLLTLLKNDASVEEYFNNKRCLYGTLVDNPYEIILNTIKLEEICH